MGTNQTWNSTYENTPKELSSPGNGDDELRNLKTTVRNRMSKEHQFSTGANARQGIHKAGSSIPFIQDSEPTVRTDGTAFESDYDEGRLWIDTSSGGRLMYIDSISSGTPTWKPVLLESVGKIQAFVSNPPSSERWVSCDGRLITDSDTSPDGTVGGFKQLIDFLQAEHGGNSNHPYYTGSSTSAYIPDLRGVSLRGLDTFEDAGSSKGLKGYDHEGKRLSGEYQEDAVVDHDHKMDHTHGSDMTSDGYDSGDGRTGSGSYTGTTVDISDDGAHEQIYDSDQRQYAYIAISTKSAIYNLKSQTEAEHHHTILRYYGLTRKASDQSAESDPDIPDRTDDWNTANENVVKNVAIYWFIKY